MYWQLNKCQPEWGVQPLARFGFHKFPLSGPQIEPVDYFYDITGLKILPGQVWPLMSVWTESDTLMSLAIS